MRYLLNIGCRFAIFVIIVSGTEPASLAEGLVALVVYTLVLAEIDHAIMHRGVNIREYIRYPARGILWGLVISIVGLTAGYIGRARDVDRSQQMMEVEKLIVDAGDRTYRLFDASGRMPDQTVDFFKLGPTEVRALKASSAADRLLELDANTFQDILLRAPVWLYTGEHTPGARRSIDTLFTDFRSRVDAYTDKLPELLAAMKQERRAAQATAARQE